MHTCTSSYAVDTLKELNFQNLEPSTVTTRVLLAAPGSLSWMIAAVFLVACLSASAYCWSLQTAQNASNSHTSSKLLVL
jgi:hypothetical protein